MTLLPIIVAQDLLLLCNELYKEQEGEASPSKAQEEEEEEGQEEYTFSMDNSNDDGVDTNIAHHRNRIHKQMWIIKKATKLKDNDNTNLKEALDDFQAVVVDQKTRIGEIME